MTDEPENHTIRLLQEMRAETNRRFDEMRAENAEFRKEALSAIVAMAKTVNVTAEAVTAIAAVQAQHSTALNIIEHDIRGIKMHVDRIEKHTGLVRA